MTKKRVEKGNPEEWCARHFHVVFTQFWNFAHTIVIHIFFDFCWTISKKNNFTMHKVSRTHFHTLFISVLQKHTPSSSVPQTALFSGHIRHSFPCSRHIRHPFSFSRYRLHPSPSNMVTIHILFSSLHTNIKTYSMT